MMAPNPVMDARAACAVALFEAARLHAMLRFVAASTSDTDWSPAEVADMFVDRAERLEQMLRDLDDRFSMKPASLQEPA